MDNGAVSRFEGITYVIACGAAKLDHPAAARDLYVGTLFRHTLTCVEANAAYDEREGLVTRVLVLSARYGLVELDRVIAPYEQRMGDPGSIGAEELTAQALALGIDWGAAVYAFLPGAYLRRLDEALRPLDVYAADVYEATGGIGDHRHVNRIVAQPLPGYGQQAATA
jgi:hypothetical protein